MSENSESSSSNDDNKSNKKVITKSKKAKISTGNYLNFQRKNIKI